MTALFPKDSLPLSVIIATTKPWPEAQLCLESLREQIQAVGGEIVLADSTGQALPENRDGFYSRIVWLKAPGRSVFQLRALAASRSRGEIIAVTEDHCRVDREWCLRILQAHREHPEVAAVGGVVENGATRHLVDWASFFVVNASFMRPIRSGLCDSVSLQANISYKRSALTADFFSQLGMMELLGNERLRCRGEKFFADDRIAVEHVQCVGFLGTCAMHFHNGRSIAGFRRESESTGAYLNRILRCPLMPLLYLRHALLTVLEKRRFIPQALAGLPLMACFLLCHFTGEFLGYVAGPGNSPQRLK